MFVEVAVAAVITLVVLGVGGAMTSIGPWYRDLAKPKWTPPNWLFGPAWTLILGLAAWAGVLAWRHAPSPADHAKIAALYAANIVLHMLWSPLFFNRRRPDLALIEIPFLWASIVALIVGLTPYARLSGGLLAPYLLWVSFAAVLNLAIVRMNAPFGSRARIEAAR